MRKVSAATVATIALIFAGSTVANAGGGGDDGKDNVRSTVTINYDGGASDPYNQGTFSGRVRASKGSDRAEEKCVRKRNVLIKMEGSGDTIESTTTDNDGRYSVSTAFDEYVEDGEYYAKVLEKRKVAAEILCRGDRSDSVTVP